MKVAPNTHISVRVTHGAKLRGSLVGPEVLQDITLGGQNWSQGVLRDFHGPMLLQAQILVSTLQAEVDRAAQCSPTSKVPTTQAVFERRLAVAKRKGKQALEQLCRDLAVRHGPA